MDSHCRLKSAALANVVCMLVVSSMYPTNDNHSLHGVAFDGLICRVSLSGHFEVCKTSSGHLSMHTVKGLQPVLVSTIISAWC
jgi:hypothetical protein